MKSPAADARHSFVSAHPSVAPRRVASPQTPEWSLPHFGPGFCAYAAPDGRKAEGVRPQSSHLNGITRISSAAKRAARDIDSVETLSDCMKALNFIQCKLYMCGT